MHPLPIVLVPTHDHEESHRIQWIKSKLNPLLTPLLKLLSNGEFYLNYSSIKSRKKSRGEKKEPSYWNEAVLTILTTQLLPASRICDVPMCLLEVNQSARQTDCSNPKQKNAQKLGVKNYNTCCYMTELHYAIILQWPFSKCSKCLKFAYGALYSIICKNRLLNELFHTTTSYLLSTRHKSILRYGGKIQKIQKICFALIHFLLTSVCGYFDFTSQGEVLE
ncbi:hypothetical protein EGR_10586 [Echinococcus granulosus]|uniref:Uncharacterized protein n=1 Tax=Echinococcus granulosus TaxID=6210 RepID=W6U0C6_ECHGR|nr:hypothetical protein EGR_10586 [Echinococcus granulosus]EUB54560.1 hypothetical protein EGR_10586 [Echinococcus granulosus]